MKSLVRKATKTIVLCLFTAFFTACTEDAAFEDVIDNIQEVPLLENGDDKDDDGQTVPGGQ